MKSPGGPRLPLPTAPTHSLCHTATTDAEREALLDEFEGRRYYDKVGRGWECQQLMAPCMCATNIDSFCTHKRLLKY